MPDALAGVLLTVLGLVLIGVLAGGAWWISQRPTPNELTNCPPTGPRAVYLVIFDQSDPATPQQAQRIRQTMQHLKATAQTGDRFDIYSFEGDAKNVLEPRLVMCRPPDKANEWIENVKRAQLRYEDFGNKLDQMVNELLKVGEQKNSPIIESLRAATITSLGSPLLRPETSVRVILFSDMIQNTADHSHYRAKPDFEDLSKSSLWPRLRPNLAGVETEIHYLLRPEAKNRSGQSIQSRGHQLFWEHLVIASGGHPPKIVSY
jgi:uncharacterized protein YneF (UPF0154 family)